MRLWAKIWLRRLGLLPAARAIFPLFLPGLKRILVWLIRARWRRSNAHNYTQVMNGIRDTYFPLGKVSVGKHTYGGLHVLSYGTSGEELRIGCYCSIAGGVRFVLGGNHRMDTFSTYPFRHRFGDIESEAQTKGPIIVEDDVWVGVGALILSGVTLAKGTIVAAGSVVTKSSEPYTVIGGNPARLIRRRFTPNLIEKLLAFDMRTIEQSRIGPMLDKLYMSLDEELLAEILRELT
jgi:virginiamycin A acetyltransferase